MISMHSKCLTPKRVPRIAHLNAKPLISLATAAANIIGKIVGPNAIPLWILAPNSDNGFLSKTRALAAKTE